MILLSFFSPLGPGAHFTLVILLPCVVSSTSRLALPFRGFFVSLSISRACWLFRPFFSTQTLPTLCSCSTLLLPLYIYWFSFFVTFKCVPNGLWEKWRKLLKKNKKPSIQFTQACHFFSSYFYNKNNNILKTNKFFNKRKGFNCIKKIFFCLFLYREINNLFLE